MLHGRVIGLRDGINFRGETVAEARKSFEESVDAYLEFCESRGEAPEKPFSGEFLVRVDPTVHRSLARMAEARGMSLAALVGLMLTDSAMPTRPKVGATTALGEPAYSATEERRAEAS